MIPMKKDSIELEGIASSPDLEVLLVGCPLQTFESEFSTM